MQSFYKFAVIVVISLFSLSACSSDDKTEQTGPATIEQPKVSVREVTTTGFKLRWDAVEGADTYTFTLDGGEESSTTGCEISFSDLKRQTEYVVAIKACPLDQTRYEASAYTYVHVITDDIEQLPKPKVTLGSAYASRTVISWSEVPEADAYEFSIGGTTAVTEGRQISFTNLAKSKQYTFSIRALTSDATRFNDSEVEELVFTTSAEDTPPIVIVPINVVSDAVAFDIYATSEVTYYYDIVTAATFARYTDEQIVSAYQQYAVEYAQSQGITFELAMASLLKSGVSELQQMNLTPELSYVIFAFGMDLKGNITSGLVSTPFKTTADGYSDGPNYGGSSWFKQSFYLTNAYAGAGTNWTNSIFNFWQGSDVVKVYYLVASTKTFIKTFPDVNDVRAISEALKNPYYELADGFLPLINGTTGYSGITSANMGTSYTMATLAISSSGEETLCVNSVTTKTSMTSTTWFLTNAVKNPNYGPTYNTFAGTMQGVDVVSCRYVVFQSAALEGVETSRYAQIVAQQGYDVPGGYIPSINGNGFALVFGEDSGVQPETGYTFIATAVNSVGDKNTNWATVTTDPMTRGAAGRSTAVRMERLGQGSVVPDLDNFIFKLETTPLPADARAESDHWTIIHNKQILN
ncbi:hypothetical protein [uncultured Alistipes sp.]|uniref:hypothetical protein n=1 Tax=uncultured Alistipes sp. TaxID=538949 RepID=UPI0025E86067|nr:hypothetical protein [uncultured Alistipes sp.]